MSRKVLLSILLCLTFVAGGLFFNTNEVTGAAKETLTAAKVKKAPAGLDDPAWQKAKAVNAQRKPFIAMMKFISGSPGKMRPKA